METKNQIFKDCEISDVYKKLPLDIYNSYLIHLRIPKENSSFSDYHDIKIDCSEFKEKLFELKNDEIERCYFAHGMCDIDFYKIKNGYEIDWSPVDGVYMMFQLSKKEFDRLLKML